MTTWSSSRANLPYITDLSFRCSASSSLIRITSESLENLLVAIMKTFFLLILFLSLLSLSLASEISVDQNKQAILRTHDEVLALYEEWLVKHGKSYNGLGEKGKRFEIFKDNLRYIDQQNSLPNRTYKLGLNQFSDLTDDEYRSMYLGTRPAANLSNSGNDRYLPKLGDSLPNSVDWREKGAVVQVKDQKKCGMCLCSFN